MQRSFRSDWMEYTKPFMVDNVFIGVVYPRKRNSKDLPPSEGYILPRDELPPGLLSLLFSTKPNLSKGASYRSFPSTHPSLKTAMSFLDKDINQEFQRTGEDRDITMGNPYRSPSSDRIRLLIELRTFLHQIIRNPRGATLETFI